MDKHLIYQTGRLLLIISTITVIYFIIKYLLIFFYPFVCAILLSYVMNPFVIYLENKFKLSRFLATAIILMLVLITIICLIMVMITEVIQGTLYLAEKIPTHFQYFLTFIQSIINDKIVPIYHKIIIFIQTLKKSQQLPIQEYIENSMTHFASSGANFLQDLLLKIPRLISVIPYSFTMIIFILIATFLITNDWYKLKKMFSQIIPISLKEISRNVFGQLEKSFLGYLKAQCILVFLTALILLIGLLVLKIDHALTISLFIALIDLIPLIGIGIVFIPWILYLFLIKSYSFTIGLTILYMFIIIIRQILEPKILSANIGLNPLAALLTLFISIKFWGLSGVVIAPFILILVSAIHQAGVTQLLWNYIKGKG